MADAEDVVAQLGPVPGDPEELTAYLTRLERVDRALTMAQQAYAAALERREDLAGRAERVHAVLAADEQGAAASAGLAEQAEALLARAPTDLTRLEAMVQAQETLARTMGVEP